MNEEIIEYIKKAKEAGQDIRQIKLSLLNAGYTKEVIDDLLRSESEQKTYSSIWSTEIPLPKLNMKKLFSKIFSESPEDAYLNIFKFSAIFGLVAPFMILLFYFYEEFSLVFILLLLFLLLIVQKLIFNKPQYNKLLSEFALWYVFFAISYFLIFLGYIAIANSSASAGSEARGLAQFGIVISIVLLSIFSVGVIIVFNVIGKINYLFFTKEEKEFANSLTIKRQLAESEMTFVQVLGIFDIISIILILLSFFS